MKFYQVMLLLQQEADRHKKKRRQRKLAKRCGVTRQKQSELKIREMTESLTYGSIAEGILRHKSAIEELQRLLEDDWYYLHWVIPTSEIGKTPRARLDMVVAVQAATRFNFIKKEPYVYLEPRYRNPELFQQYEVGTVEYLISLLGLRHLNRRREGLAWETLHMLGFLRANEHVVS